MLPFQSENEHWSTRQFSFIRLQFAHRHKHKFVVCWRRNGICLFGNGKTDWTDVLIYGKLSVGGHGSSIISTARPSFWPHRGAHWDSNSRPGPSVLFSTRAATCFLNVLRSAESHTLTHVPVLPVCRALASGPGPCTYTRRGRHQPFTACPWPPHESPGGGVYISVERAGPLGLGEGSEYTKGIEKVIEDTPYVLTSMEDFPSGACFLLVYSPPYSCRKFNR
jgi:hypothetical protein